MSFVIFDCTQFITFDLVRETDINDLVSDFKEIGFEILIDKTIKTKKLVYLNEFVSSNVVELVWDEFLGAFEDWEEKNNTPHEIVQFSNCITQLVKSNLLKNLKIILVSSASENKDEDRIFTKEIVLNQIENGLFYMSGWCFDVNADVVVLSVEQ